MCLPNLKQDSLDDFSPFSALDYNLISFGIKRQTILVNNVLPLARVRSGYLLGKRPDHLRDVWSKLLARDEALNWRCSSPGRAVGWGGSLPFSISAQMGPRCAATFGSESYAFQLSLDWTFVGIFQNIVFYSECCFFSLVLSWSFLMFISTFVALISATPIFFP